MARQDIFIICCISVIIAFILTFVSFFIGQKRQKKSAEDNKIKYNILFEKTRFTNKSSCVTGKDYEENNSMSVEDSSNK